jgi:predicted phosphodiesterase
MTDFQIVSDLHIEYKNNEIPDPLTLITPTSDILILAGDIGSLYKYDQLYGFLRKLCLHFKNVLYIPGNHEFYMVPNDSSYQPLPMNQLIDRLYLLEKQISNLFILNRSSVIINNICILGCTLWSKVEVVLPRFIVRIHGMTNYLYDQKYTSDLKYINKMIKYCKNNKLKLVVVTHHCPSYSVLLNSHKSNDKYVSLYVSKLDHLLNSSNVHTWVAGHTHKNFDFITDGGTRLVSNQRGKPKDNVLDFSKSFVVKIDQNNLLLNNVRNDIIIDTKNNISYETLVS